MVNGVLSFEPRYRRFTCPAASEKSPHIAQCGRTASTFLDAVLSRVEGGKTALQVVLEIADIFQSDVKPQRRPARRPFGGGAVRLAVEGNHEAFEAAPRIAHAE